jgi:tetratricopeptide (TPR) repeat protein
LSENPDSDVVDLPLAKIVEKVVGRRLIWLFVLPFAITAVTVAMFFVLSKRLNDVEVGTKLVTIERYFATDHNYRAAIDQYETLAKSYSSAPILTRLGTLYFMFDKEKNTDIAIQKLEMAKRVDPGYPEIYRSLTFIYLSTAQLRQAIETGQKALELNADDAGTYNNLAWLHATAKEPFLDLKLALDYARKAVALTGDKQPDFLDTLAQVYYNLGDRDNALASFRRAKAAALGDMQNLQGHFKQLFPEDTL